MTHLDRSIVDDMNLVENATDLDAPEVAEALKRLSPPCQEWSRAGQPRYSVQDWPELRTRCARCGEEEHTIEDCPRGA